MSKVLVTGGGGYIGAVLCEELFNLGYDILCLDRFICGDDILTALSKKVKIVQDDIRFVNSGVFAGIDTVMDLAGIPNDPACDLNPAFTEDINHRGSLRVARLARQAGVKRFIYASSCSVYGAGAGRFLTEDAALNPVSLYAKTKIQTEIDLRKLACSNFCVTILRNATVYGVSPCMRLDLLVNLMTAHAVTRRKISILGGGKQWRPNAHIKDICGAFIQVMTAAPAKVNGETFNVGTDGQNCQVIEVANMIRDIIPGVTIEMIPDKIEKRSYHVSFGKIHKILGFKTKHTIAQGIGQIGRALESGAIDINDTRTVRVNYYKDLLFSSQISNEINGKLLQIEQ